MATWARNAGVIRLRGTAIASSSEIGSGPGAWPAQPSRLRADARLPALSGAARSGARRPLQGPRARTELPRTLCSDIGFYEDTDTRIGVPHFLATQCLRTKVIKPQFPNGTVSSVSFVSTTNTARSLAGSVSLALALTLWRSPGSSEKLCPALKVVTGPSLT
jgi:hypothetical protein